MISSVMRSFAKFYTPTHEWIDIVGRVGTVGITSYAVHHLGDVNFVEPQIGKEVKAGDELCDIESTKATSPIFAPLPGKIIEANKAVQNDPSLVNKSPEKEGWILKLGLDSDDTSKLMNEAEYNNFLKSKS
ncbi:glycine cleavage system protein GcvH [Histomonas meleagridis]|uniref:glycine cleavage system protein GcvH n=1 Tax=Histomonas meleagridis TaxID=135588 RepID=UPI00355940B7|nr:glycine cleavage system protein GcvH [Histomonas meleagridis]KAH0799366.1 glycine cleavage system protein GcvH [Histomonas meleagridis]